MVPEETVHKVTRMLGSPNGSWELWQSYWWSQERQSGYGRWCTRWWFRRCYCIGVKYGWWREKCWWFYRFFIFSSQETFWEIRISVLGTAGANGHQWKKRCMCQVCGLSNNTFRCSSPPFLRTFPMCPYMVYAWGVKWFQYPADSWGGGIKTWAGR